MKKQVFRTKIQIGSNGKRQVLYDINSPNTTVVIAAGELLIKETEFTSGYCKFSIINRNITINVDVDFLNNLEPIGYICLKS